MKQFIFILLISQLFISKTKAQTNPQVGVFAGGLLVYNSTQKPTLVGYYSGLGVYHTSDINSKFYLDAGVQLAFSKISNYRNSIRYVSNWVSGVEFTQVELRTSISQNHIEIPISLSHRFTPKFSLGIGCMFSVLLSSKLNQNVEGHYVIDKYPNEDSLFNKSIHFQLSKENDYNTSMFVQTNLFPFLSSSYSVKKFKISAIFNVGIFSSTDKSWSFNVIKEIKPYLLITYNLKKS